MNYDPKERLLTLAQQYELTPKELLETVGFAGVGVPSICVNTDCPDWSDDRASGYCGWCGTLSVVSCVQLAEKSVTPLQQKLGRRPLQWK